MTTIKLKNGSGAPTAGDLVQGEPALDLTNKRLYTEDSGGTVIEVGTNPTSITTGDITATGTATFANLATSGDVTFGDNDKAIFGAGSDLQIYHDGTNSYIVNTTNDLIIGEDTRVRIKTPSLLVNNAADTENLLTATENGAVTLYYDNAAKIATTSTGIDVTGSVTADGLTVESGAANIGIVTKSTDQFAFIGFEDNTSSASSVYVGADGNDFIARSNSLTRFRAASNGDISFYEDTGTTAKLFWDASAESLGIGTSPTAALHVSNSSAAGESIAVLEASSTKNGYVYINADDNRRKSLVFQSGGVDKFSMGVGDSDELSTSSFFIGSGKHGGSAADLVIDSAGNVGIGTASPSFGLSVESDNGSGYAALFRKSSSDPALAIQTTSGITQIQGLNSALNATYGIAMQVSGGNVGIGTSSPSTALHVNSGVTNEAARFESTDTEVVLELKDTTGTAKIKSRADFRFETGATPSEAMRIDSSGNLLVGTTVAPNTLLGASSTQGLAVNGSSGYLVAAASGQATAYFNRQTSDGTITEFRKDGTTVGSIGTEGGALYISSPYGTDSGLKFASSIVAPSTTTGANRDAAIDLGYSSSRFKDLYLSGVARLGTSTTYGTIEGKTNSDLEIIANAGQVNGNPNIIFKSSNAGGSVTERMRIDSSGNVQIGTAAVTGGRYFDIYNTGSTATDFAITRFITQQVGSSSTTSADIYKRKNGEFGFANNDTNSAAYINFKVGTSDRMRITAAGDLLFGKDTTAVGTAGLNVANAGSMTASIASGNTYHVYDTTNSAYRFYVSSAGQINATSTSITAISDESLKQNIRDLDKGLDTVLALQPRRFDWKNGDGNDIMGFVAQEVEEVMPELVHDYQYSETETKLGLKMGDMVPTLVKAIQDQQEIIDNLKSRIEQLEGAN